jgi:hypothetical protein
VRDVTVVALSLGEPYAERALAALRRQTCGPMPIVPVVGVRPFYRALNEGAARVATEFFLQLDADMIPHDWCVAELRAAMEDDVGLAVGALWDPLIGTLAGIKLFRTESVRRLPFRDRPAPDVDFYRRLPEHRWRAAYVLPAMRAASDTPWPTVGHHRPDYTPSYTFTRFHVLGGRLRWREDGLGVRLRYERLRRSAHPLATLARIALVAGFCRPDGADSPERLAAAAAALATLLSDIAVAGARAGDAVVGAAADVDEIERWLVTGIESRITMDGRRFRRALEVAERADCWPARLALCHGVVGGTGDANVVRAAARMMLDADGPHGRNGHG